MDCIYMRVWISWMYALSGSLEKLRQNQLWPDYFKHMVPQVQMSNFNGTHLTKILYEYLRYGLTPSEHVWCKSLAHYSIIRFWDQHIPTTQRPHLLPDISVVIKMPVLFWEQLVQLVKHTNNKKNTVKKYAPPLKLYRSVHSN